MNTSSRDLVTFEAVTTWLSEKTDKQVVGWCRDPFACPLSWMLSDLCPTATSITVWGAEYIIDEEPYPLPMWAQKLVHRVDEFAGDWLCAPELWEMLESVAE